MFRDIKKHYFSDNNSLISTTETESKTDHPADQIRPDVSSVIPTIAPASGSIVKSFRSTLFVSKTANKTCALSNLPDDLLEWTGSFLTDKEKSLMKFAQTSKALYQTLYPAIKTVLVKVLKELVKQDDTVQVEKLLRCHPYLLLRIEEGDPKGRAYQGIVATPYQDTLADPIAEEMRNLLEQYFPGETKKEKLAHAALQAEEFRDAHFAPFREEMKQVRELTIFAYQTWMGRHNAWEESQYADTHYQALCDAWMRVDLAQKRWPKRLRKIFSAVDMDKQQTFKNLPRDLPEPNFYGVKNHLWRSDVIGCDLSLHSIEANQDSEAEFRVNLSANLRKKHMLVRHGEGETATYYLYAPHISLDRDESEWRLVPVEDLNVIQLISHGCPDADPVVESVDFSKEALKYSPNFEELYQFGVTRGLHLGSGAPSIFACYNYIDAHWTLAGRIGQQAAVADSVGAGAVRGVSNFVAVTTLFETRTESLAAHLTDLEHYLPAESQEFKF